MKMWQKVAIGAAVVVVGAGIVLYSVNQANKGVTTVQTAKVGKQDTLVSLVTASGEIKPTTYTKRATVCSFRKTSRPTPTFRRNRLP